MSRTENSLRRIVRKCFEQEVTVKYRRNTSELPVAVRMTNRFVVKHSELEANIGILGHNLGHDLAAEVKRWFSKGYTFTRPGLSMKRKADGWYIMAGISIWEAS